LLFNLSGVRNTDDSALSQRQAELSRCHEFASSSGLVLNTRQQQETCRRILLVATLKDNAPAVSEKAQRIVPQELTRMEKPYFSTIRSGSDRPYLGVFVGQFHTWDASTVGPEVQILSIGKGIGKYRTKNRNALVGNPNIKCVLTNDLDAETVRVLETLPHLEHLQVHHRPILAPLNLEGLSKCRMVVLSEVSKLENLELVANMPALESLFVNGPKALDVSALATLELRELALWCFLSGTQLDPLFDQSTLQYLCLGGFKPMPDEYSRFREFKHLECMEINSRSHPFDFYANLDGVLPKNVERNWKLLVRLRENCTEHPGHPLLQASGSRQKPFCELCSPKRLKRLSDCYEMLSGTSLPIPPVDAEQFGWSKDDGDYFFFS